MALADLAREMRRNPGEPEKRLWRALSRSQLSGFKFRRQAVIGGWIVDFLCPAKALVVEVDGDEHDPERDRARDAALSAMGYKIVRFGNRDVMGSMEGVLQTILSILNAQPDRWPAGRPHPNPSPEGEGLSSGPTVSPSSSEEGLGW